MAECSYARCVQQRRNIRRELQRWTRNMVHIVGLERIAEELMGRRKWKLYQESMSRNYLQPLNNNIKTRTNQEEFYKNQQQLLLIQQEEQQNVNEKHLKDNLLIRDENGKEETDQQKENEGKPQEVIEDRLKDWTPETKCYFCVDGKLDSEHTTHGVLSPRQSDSESSDSHSDNDIPPSLTPSATGLLNNNNNNNNNHYRPHHPHHHLHRSTPNLHPVAPVNMTTMESVTSLTALAAAFSGNSQGTPAPPLPFYPNTIIPPTWYLANVARTFQQVDRLTPATAASANDTDKTTGGEQPLDLSKGSATNNIGSNIVTPITSNNNLRLSTLDTNKQIFNSDCRAKPRMSAVASRRTYTEDELQAALRDIQSGKLGTRRAAVIYGIPRSTLRNKVYKLALERERESHLTSTTPLKLDEEEVMDDDKELSGAEEEKEVEKALRAPLCDILRFSNMELPSEALKTILQRTKEGGHEAWGGLEHSEVGPYIQNLLLASQSLLPNPKLVDNAVLSNIIPEFLKRLLNEEQLKAAQQHNNGDNEKLMRPSPSNSVTSKSDRLRSESDMETDENPSNVILKIPSFKPTSSKNGCDLYRSQLDTNSMVSPPVTSESGSPPILTGKGIKDVKDIIAQSISQKFQQNLEPARRPPSMVDPMDFKRGGFTPPLTGGISVIKNQQDLGRSNYQPQNKPQQNTSSSSSSTGGKGTRPKRGKYRNYDRDSLVEAVKAVQRGEMSVHRAGSYYGVPHSTLEYKVKERHLMRPRKRDPKPNPVDEKLASLKNDIRNPQDNKMKPTSGGGMKPPQKYPPTSPNGMKLPMFNEPGMTPPIPSYSPAAHFPFWPHTSYHIPLEFPRNPTAPYPSSSDFFASQMIQKIQEERATNPTNKPGIGTTPTLPNSARQIAESLLDGTGSNGSFLDGIIRSSLEQGVPPNEDKSPKEDKNVAPENMSNKALLDQLCRNSRLTPLTKPSTEPNSSGDESYRKETSPINFSGTSNSKDHHMDDSPIRSESNSDLPTIELSNDSNDSSGALSLKNKKMKEDKNDSSPSPTPPLTTATTTTATSPLSTTTTTTTTTQQNSSTVTTAAPPARIYLKKDLANPDNLQPEMLIRFRDILPDTERNGINEGIIGSASDNDAPQD